MIRRFPAVFFEGDIEVFRIVNAHHLADPVSREVCCKQQLLRLLKPVIADVLVQGDTGDVLKNLSRIVDGQSGNLGQYLH
ncbi:hypothetical protein D3C80_2119190 [compost metagenome]